MSLSQFSMKEARQLISSLPPLPPTVISEESIAGLNTVSLLCNAAVFLSGPPDRCPLPRDAAVGALSEGEHNGSPS